MSQHACKSCERGDCENDINACRDPVNCACCGREQEAELDQEGPWDPLDYED